MIKSPVILFFLLFSIAACSQNKPIYVYDYETGVLDSLPIIEFDTTLTFGKTEFHVGYFNSSIANLSLNEPIEDLYPQSIFTVKKPVEEVYTLQDYPVRTSVKIHGFVDGEVLNRCSGSMISRRHVLSGAHCYVGNENNVFDMQTLMASPVYNNGEFDPNFGSVFVSKIYFTKNWSFEGEDFAILELTEPIGDETGWISVGFNDDTDELFDGIFYKFSYPSTTIEFLDTNQYNGDTIYFNYGVLDVETASSIGANGTNGIPGESGSSIIKVSEQPEYTSYGVLSFSNNLMHQRFKNNSFHLIQDIISDDLILGVDEMARINYSVWPNPTKDILNVEGVKLRDVIGLTIFDSFGKTISANYTRSYSKLIIDTCSLQSGLYFLRLEAINGTVTEKFIKL